MKMRKQFIQGFTLIELLVVIAIIALLATIVIVSVQKSIQNARDTRRKADIRSLKTAIEQYANNNNGRYPVMAQGNVSGLAGVATFTDYISPVPNDPIPTQSYTYAGSTSYYGLIVQFEGITYGTNTICQTGLIDPTWPNWTYPNCGF